MLNAPQDDLPLPDALQQRLDNAKNSVDILEIETSRLSRLLTDQKEQLSTIQGEKKNLESQIESSKVILNKLIEDITSKTLEHDTLQSLVKTGKNDLMDLQLKSRDIETGHTEKSRELDQREGAIKAFEESLNKRNIDLIAKETQHNQKVAKLEEALK